MTLILTTMTTFFKLSTGKIQAVIPKPNEWSAPCNVLRTKLDPDGANIKRGHSFHKLHLGLGAEQNRRH